MNIRAEELLVVLNTIMLNSRMAAETLAQAIYLNRAAQNAPAIATIGLNGNGQRQITDQRSGLQQEAKALEDAGNRAVERVLVATATLQGMLSVNKPPPEV